MINREKLLRDSSQGIGSMGMMAFGDENEMQVPTDMIEDPEGRFQTEDSELIMQIMESGKLAQIKQELSPDDLSDIMAVYDSAIEGGTFDGTFDEFLAQMVATEIKKGADDSGMDKGIMSVMRG